MFYKLGKVYICELLPLNLTHGKWSMIKSSFYAVFLFLILILASSCEQVQNARLKKAVMERDFMKVRELVKHGADPNTKIDVGSVLGHTISSGDPETVKILVKHGADINAYQPLPALGQAAMDGKPEIAEFLIKEGAVVKGPAVAKAPPLELAAACGNWKTFKVIVDHGGDIFQTSSRNYNMLHSASHSANPQIMSFLIDKGIDVNVANHKGEAPLHILLKNDSINEESIQILIENGANPEIEDNNGKTPRDIARENGHLDTLEKILSRHKEQ